MKRLSLTWLLISSLSLASFAQAETQMPQSRFADFDGVKVHYQAVGAGSKAVVFVHGWTCSADFWRQSITALPEYSVIAIDLPGHGHSDKPRTDYTMDYFARSIEAVMRDAGTKAAVLVGHSMGTPVIRQFYRLYPQQTLGLVIVDGSLRSVARKEVERSIAPLRVNYPAGAAKSVDGMLEPIRDEKLKQEIRSAMLATPDYVGLSALEGMMDEKIWTNDQINVPVLAILAQSPWWKPDTETVYRSIAPDLDFRMWQDVSHFLMMERPAEFNEAVRGFISKNKLL